MEHIPPAPLATLDEEEDDASPTNHDVNTSCGYFNWRPKYLQIFNKPEVLVVCISFYSLSLGFMVNGIVNISLSSLERRFDLKSTNVGFITSSYDISAAFLAVVAGFYGSGQKKPRLIAMSIFCSALGSLIMALPHFTTDNYSLGMTSRGLCENVNTANETCSALRGESSRSNYLYVFLLGQLLHGIGGTTMFTVGVSLIDDCVMPNRTPLFLGIVYGCNILGAGLGHTIGGQFLNIYVDFDVVSDIDLTPKDKRWIGAWWLGPILSAVAQIGAALPISLFGSELPSSRKVQHLRLSQAHIRSSTHLSGKLGNSRFLNNTLQLLKNPCFVFVSLAMVMEGMCMTGLAAFLPKFVENQYGVTSARAAMMTGSAVIPAAAGGLVLGGWIAKHFNLDVRQSIKMIMILAVASGLCSGFIWIRCDHKDIYGVQVQYSGKSKSNSPVNLVSSCNSMCNCDTDSYTPVCGNRTQLYFSPCHAGCTSKSGHEYRDCTCVAELNLPEYANQTSSTLSSLSCESTCDELYVFVFLLFFTLCLSFLPIAPADSIQLRCVPEESKTHAQGVKTLIVRILGSFVGPIVVGKLLDLNCEVWRKKCGDTLSCWLYDQDMLVASLYIFILLCKGFSILFCSLAYKFYQPPEKPSAATERNQGVEMEENDDEKNDQADDKLMEGMVFSFSELPDRDDTSV